MILTLILVIMFASLDKKSDPVDPDEPVVPDEPVDPDDPDDLDKPVVDHPMLAVFQKDIEWDHF